MEPLRKKVSEVLEESRYERINRVRAVIYLYKDKIKTMIHDLIDHKGELTVYWASKPSEDEKEMVENIWALEYEIKVIHEVK